MVSLKKYNNKKKSLNEVAIPAQLLFKYLAGLEKRQNQNAG